MIRILALGTLMIVASVHLRSESAAQISMQIPDSNVLASSAGDTTLASSDGTQIKASPKSGTGVFQGTNGGIPIWSNTPLNKGSSFTASVNFSTNPISCKAPQITIDVLSTQETTVIINGTEYTGTRSASKLCDGFAITPDITSFVLTGTKKNNIKFQNKDPAADGQLAFLVSYTC